MDRIDTFRMFARVVETGSFSKAARDLAVTQPTVTRQIASLEERIGARLLNRNTRRLSVTELGERYYEKSKALLDSFEDVQGLTRSKAAPVHGRIRLGTSVGFGRRVITPLVLEFMRQYPEVEFDLSFEDAYVDLVAQGIDLAVRMGKLADSSLGARYLGLNPWVIVAAPSYLKRRGRPAAPQELVGHNVLVYNTVQGDDHLHFNDPKHGRMSVRVHGRLRSNNLSTILAAVRGGMGVAALPLYVAAPSIAAKQVQPLLREFHLASQEIHAVYPSPRLLPAKVGVLIEFLRTAFQSADWPNALTSAATRR